MPVLIEWLPRISNVDVKESMVRHLNTRMAKPVAAEPLLNEFRQSENAHYKWVVAETLQHVCTNHHFPDIVGLAADPRHGIGRAPLVEMLWRVKTPEADEIMAKAIDDPNTARFAMSALRRRRGNEVARPLIEPLLHHPHEWVRQAAKDHLHRIDKSARSSPTTATRTSRRLGPRP